jgi:RNA polymerase sigma-70 factor (TIGR02943 family)
MDRVHRTFGDGLVVITAVCPQCGKQYQVEETQRGDTLRCSTPGCSADGFVVDGSTGPDRTEPALWVERHGDTLFRYALFRVGDSQAAADLVQETFLAALKARGDFAGQSSERTWLLGILKHKLADHFRRQGRQCPVSAMQPETETLADFFDERGRWRVKPGPAPADPAAALEREEFWETFRGCLGRLPARLAAAFALREVDGLTSEEICEQLDVSANNLWVLLHRARLSLGRCLDVHGFGGDGPRS